MSKTDKGRRVRRNASRWSALIAEQAGSGLSHRVFCESRGLSLSSFGNAKRRIARVSLGRNAVNDFVAIPLPGPGFGLGHRAEFGLWGGVASPSREMWAPNASLTVWLYRRPTDMRKSYDGLSALAKQVLEEDPLGGGVF